MRTQTKRILLDKITLKIDDKTFSLPGGTLEFSQQYPEDGLGGFIDGIKSWQINLSSPLSRDFLKYDDPIEFISGEYSGYCLANSNVTLKGTGPITGF